MKETPQKLEQAEERPVCGKLISPEKAIGNPIL